MADPLQDVADAIERRMPTPVAAVVAIIVDIEPLTVTWGGSDPIPAVPSWAFQFARDTLSGSGTDLTGMSVLVHLPDGQPIATDIIMGG